MTGSAGGTPSGTGGSTSGTSGAFSRPSDPTADRQLLDRVLAALAQGTSSPDEPSLAARLTDPEARETIRRRMESYATAAPEYIDEDLQAAARTLLARHFQDTRT